MTVAMKSKLALAQARLSLLTVDHRKLSADAREPLLDAIAERIRTRLDDRVRRRYLSMLRTGQRAD